jgi:protoporphyrinogen oxidase
MLRNTDLIPIAIEKESQVGGLARTINFEGNRLDIGGHRFFSKNDQIMKWWLEILPCQGSEAKDELLLGETFGKMSEKGPNPEIENEVMLIRRRISRIFFLRKFFDYPIKLNFELLQKMGFLNSLKSILSFIKSVFIKQKEDSLEKFFINRFGRYLYQLFFENYTEKVWGLHPSKISAEWGQQRIKGISLFGLLKNAASNLFKKDTNSINQKSKETSLIERFYYPKFGPGQMWEKVADKIIESGGEIIKESCVSKINFKDKKIESVIIEKNNKISLLIDCDYVISTMPVKELFNAFSNVSITDEITEIAKGLQYRDFITIGILLNKLKIKNDSKLKTLYSRIPDTWIYVQERDVKIGRIQIFNNWSPYMVEDNENTVWLGLEYFCFENDDLWRMPDDTISEFAIKELERIGIIDADDVIKSKCIRIKKAYPTYYGTYSLFEKLKDFVNTIDNLFLIGRNGQHRYNNMDHSMLAAIEMVNNLKHNIVSKDNIWKINTESEYHETR